MKNIFKLEIDSHRIFGLDILRAFAILCVIMGHGTEFLSNRMAEISTLFIFDGVSMFFVLSGFLIGGILIKAIDKNGINKTTLWNFWIRRWWRTLPNYFLILSILCILSILFQENFNPLNIVQYFFFSQNLFFPHPSFFPEAWSLSVEEWFYLILPIIIATFSVVRLSHKKSLLIISISIIFLVTLFRLYRYLHIPNNQLAF